MPSFKKNGFTLVELLMVVGIIGLLTTSAIVGVVGSKRTTALNRAAKEVLLVLRDAQNKSLITQAGGSGSTPCGFGAHYASSTGIFIFTEETSPQGGDCLATGSIDRKWGSLVGVDNIVERFTLTEDNYVKIISAFPDIYFEPPDGLTYINGVHDNIISSSTEINLCLISDCVHYQKKVRVDLGGNIEIE